MTTVHRLARKAWAMAGVSCQGNQSQHFGSSEPSSPELRLGIRSASHWRTGFARGHHHDPWQTTSATRSGVRRGNQREGVGIEAMVAAARRTAEGRAQRAARHDG
jgi:hypothetical protein